MPAPNGPLSGLKFAFAGAQSLPEEVIRKVIRDAGGSVDDRITDQTTHVLSSDEMSSVWCNSYKLQFFPEFEAAVRLTHSLGLPVVSYRFVEAQLMSPVRLDSTPFLVLSPSDLDSDSILDERVQSLVNLVFDRAAFQRALSDLSLDTSRVLNMTEADLTAAYAALSDVERALALRKAKKADPEVEQRLADCSRRFYDVVPLTERPPIDSEQALKQKLDTVQSLADILVAARTMKTSVSSSVEQNYRKLRTSIRPLERWMREYDVIKGAVEGGKASIHADFDIQLEQIYEIERDGECDRFAPFESRRHHRLLWHGSRLANYIGILSSGLRIAPPEAPVTGYFLGKGVYFADMLSKSIEYCRPTKQDPHVLLMLCQVYLGRMYQTAHSKFLAKEDLDENDYQSVKGCGEFAPDPAYDVESTPGVLIALGREARTGVTRSELKHNEYVVYRSDQIRIKYLVQLKVVSVSGKDIKAMSLVDAN